MLKFQYLALLLCTVIGALSCQSTKSLFNGNDLKGWTAYGTEKWYVDNGTLVAESGPDEEYGYFCTDEYYDDFEITLDFKLEANGNSGLFVRSTVEGTKVSGWQVEIAPNVATGGVYESYGRGWLKQVGDDKKGVLLPDDWNSMKVRLVGDVLTSWLNGTEMVQLEDEKIGAGKGGICLQIHDGGGIKVRFKNIKIKTLN